MVRRGPEKGLLASYLIKLINYTTCPLPS